MTGLGKFLRLSRQRQHFFLEACFCLGVARVAIRLLPFRRIAPWLGRPMCESPYSDPAEPVLLETLLWALRSADRNVPWDCKCLVQALAGKAMLRRRGVPSTLYLGVLKEVDNGMRAHAWLRCGGKILTGRRGMKRFTVVASFAETKG